MKVYLLIKSTTQPQYVDYNSCMDYAEPYNEVHSAYFNKEEALHVRDLCDATVVNEQSDNDDEECPETFFWVQGIEVQ